MSYRCGVVGLTAMLTCASELGAQEASRVALHLGLDFSTGPHLVFPEGSVRGLPSFVGGLELGGVSRRGLRITGLLELATTRERARGADSSGGTWEQNISDQRPAVRGVLQVTEPLFAGRLRVGAGAGVLYRHYEQLVCAAIAGANVCPIVTATPERHFSPAGRLSLRYEPHGARSHSAIEVGAWTSKTFTRRDNEITLALVLR